MILQNNITTFRNKQSTNNQVKHYLYLMDTFNTELVNHIYVLMLSVCKEVEARDFLTLPDNQDDLMLMKPV